MSPQADPVAAVLALNRFGFGARPGDLALAASDPRGFVLEELHRPGAAALGDQALLPTPSALQAVFLDNQMKRMEREKVAMAATAAAATPPAAEEKSAPSAPQPPKPPSPEQSIFREEAMARFKKQTSAPCGFVERLVAFWSNHFAISVNKSGIVRAAAGPFEREAIRPHVLGRFAQLLNAVESHPAMIAFLDNQRSIGPNANAGRLAGRGLNENLAREILELHTLGVDGGYSQADVTELARIITGWSFAGEESEVGEPGAYFFKANWHEPGPHSLLGKTYPQTGRDQGDAALVDLARHPATAKHIATKLVRHFVADNPPQDLVDTLAKKFQETDGDLFVVSTALVADDRAWRPHMTKIRTPLEFIVAAARATNFQPPEPGPYLNWLNVLGMPLWQPGGPNGFPDTAAAWASPEAMKLRLNLSQLIAQRARNIDQPVAVLDAVCGPAASPETRQAMERAESKPQALALLFMSPEFQRR